MKQSRKNCLMTNNVVINHCIGVYIMFASKFLKLMESFFERLWPKYQWNVLFITAHELTRTIDRKMGSKKLIRQWKGSNSNTIVLTTKYKINILFKIQPQACISKLFLNAIHVSHWSFLFLNRMVLKWDIVACKICFSKWQKKIFHRTNKFVE